MRGEKLFYCLHFYSPLVFKAQIVAWFQRTTNRKWPMGNRMVTCLTKSRDPERDIPNFVKAFSFAKMRTMQ